MAIFLYPMNLIHFFKQHKKLTAFLGLVLAMLFWSGNTLLTRANVGIIPPFALAFYRWSIAAILLLIINYKHMLSYRTLFIQEYKKITCLAFLGICLYSCIIYAALQTTSAINANMIGASTPLITTLLTWIVIKEKTNFIQLLSILLACAGVSIVISKGSIRNLIGISFNHGDLLTIVAVLTWSSYSVLIQKWKINLPPFVFLTFLASLGSIALLFFYVAENISQHLFMPTQTTLPTILYLAIFPSMISYSLWLHAVKVLGSSLTAFCGYMQILFTTTLACIFLNETLHLYQVTGGLFTLIGLYLYTVNKAPVHIQESH